VAGGAAGGGRHAQSDGEDAGGGSGSRVLRRLLHKGLGGGGSGSSEAQAGEYGLADDGVSVVGPEQLTHIHAVLALHTHAASARSSAAGAPEDITTDIVGTASFDWRAVLSAEDLCLSSLLHLLPAGPGPHATGASDGAPIPTGLLALELRIVPPLAEPRGLDRASALRRSLGGSAGDAEASELRRMLSRMPRLRPAPLPAADVTHAIQKETRTGHAAGRAFFAYAKAWWSEYKSVHPSFRQRLVKLFGETVRGDWQPLPTFLVPLSGGRLLPSPAHAARFVALLPLRQQDAMVGAVGAGAGVAASRRLEQQWNSPSGSGSGSGSGSRDLYDAPPVGMSRREVWRAPHVSLCLRQGDLEDHAVLLCGLLLGFGLDAYVCIGTRTAAAAAAAATASAQGEAVQGGAEREEEYTWVMTRYGGSGPQGAGTKVVFWDPLTGDRVAVCDGSGGMGMAAAAPHAYRRIACAFNHESYFANHALDDRVPSVDWAAGWGDITQWKPMEPRLIQALPHAPSVPLAPPSFQPLALSEAIEAGLKDLASQHRRLMRGQLDVRRSRSRAQQRAQDRARTQSTASSLRAAGMRAADEFANEDADGDQTDPAAFVCDPWLEHKLGAALVAYETERLHGIAAGSEEFASAVKRHVPRGLAFRGFPFACNHTSPSRILEAFLASPVARSILETPFEPGVSFALRVQVALYPEDVGAAWVMLACTSPLHLVP
jgi:hypothetical protein